MRKSRVWAYGPAGLYMICIFILSSIPSVRPPDLGLNYEDKIAHVLEYTILGALLMRGGLLRHPASVRLFFTVFIIGTLYGASDELHQRFVPNRFASPWDALADMIGILLGMILFRVWKKCHTKPEP